MIIYNSVDLLQDRLEKALPQDKFAIAIEGDISLEELKTYKLAELKYKLNIDITSGFYSISLNKHFDYEMHDQQNLSSMLSLLQMDEEMIEIDIKTSDDEMITITRDEYIALYKESVQEKNKKQKKYNALKVSVDGATDKESLKNINY